MDCEFEGERRLVCSFILTNLIYLEFFVEN